MTSIELDRRSLLVAGAATTGAVALGVSLPDDAEAATRNRYFKHGVASGDPHPTSVILWTRVTPTPEATPGSGKGPAVTVRWQVSRTRDFKKIVSQGWARTGAGRGVSDFSWSAALTLDLLATAPDPLPTPRPLTGTPS